MAAPSSEKQEKIIALLRERVDIGRNAFIKHDPYIENYLKFAPDMTIDDGHRLIVVELKAIARFETISSLYLLKNLLQKEMSDKKIVVILIARAILPQMERIAEEYGVLLLPLPPNIKAYDGSPIFSGSQKQKTRITAEKSWKVVSSLLKNKFSTIRQISVQENVSYGLTHLVIKNLEEQGVVEQNSGYYEVTDIKKLLNAVAWVRPFESLSYSEFTTYYDNSYEAAREISKWLRANDMPAAFTGHTAGSLYTGYGIRYDTAYLYLKKEDINKLMNQFKIDGIKNVSSGIKIRIYSPDRDVFSYTRVIESVTVASPSQVLLDLAGLGYSGMDMTNAMVEKYARL